MVNEGGDPANTNYGFGLYLKSNGFAHNGYSSSGDQGENAGLYR